MNAKSLIAAMAVMAISVSSASAGGINVSELVKSSVYNQHVTVRTGMINTDGSESVGVGYDVFNKFGNITTNFNVDLSTNYQAGTLKFGYGIDPVSKFIDPYVGFGYLNVKSNNIEKTSVSLGDQIVGGGTSLSDPEGLPTDAKKVSKSGFYPIFGLNKRFELSGGGNIALDAGYKLGTVRGLTAGVGCSFPVMSDYQVGFKIVHDEIDAGTETLNQTGAFATLTF